jgi:hypothetical protein
MAFAVSMTSFGDVRQPILFGYMMLQGPGTADGGLG